MDARLNVKCPECGHVLMWSTGRLRKLIFRKWRKKWPAVKFWYCSVGHDENWDVPACRCRNEAHNLDKELVI